MTEPVTGQDLRLRRTAMDVTSTALAKRIGVAPSWVSRWEGSRKVKPEAAERYLTALATFGTVPTVTVEAA